MGGYNISYENIFIWVGVLNRSKFLEQKVAPWCLFLSFFLGQKMTFFPLSKHKTIYALIFYNKSCK